METRPFVAVVLGQGFDDPPLRLFPGMATYHLLVLSAATFMVGVAIYNIASS